MKSAALQRVCQALTQGDRAAAAHIARSDYPFAPPDTTERQYTAQQMMRVFVRDGFIDRYSGERLVFPGTLRLLSELLPRELPYHRNWKLSATHPMYWDLCPTLDHVVPVARGGADDEHNQVTTTQLNNSAKAHWTLDELGWTLHEPGRLEEWDGLTGWFLAYVEEHPEAVRGGYLQKWWRGADRLRDVLS